MTGPPCHDGATPEPAPSRQNLVLLPGLDGIAELRNGAITALTGHFNVTAISWPVDRPMSYAELRAWLADRLPSQPFTLVAESFAGPVGIDLAADHVPGLSALILVSTFARNPLPSALARAAHWIAPQDFPRPLLNAIMMGRHTTPQLSAALQSAIARVPAAVLQDRMVSALRVNSMTRLLEIDCPVLCIVGTKDRLIRPSLGREMQQHIRGCELQTIDASHMLLETHPHECAAIIDEFCRRVSCDGERVSSSLRTSRDEPGRAAYGRRETP